MPRITFLLLPFTFIFFMAAATAQCDYTPSAKVAKLIEQSKDKKYSSDERFDFLEKALEEDPACLPCMMRLGELSFLRAKHSGASFSAAQTYFSKLTELCENWHSEQYYYLGAMAYADMKYSEAENYFNKFLRFPDDDPTKFEKDYDKKYAEVEEALKSVAQFKEIYEHKIDYSPVKVSGVSSDLDDYLPCITPDGEIMFYTRKILKQAKGDIMAREIEQMTWSHRPDINHTFDGGEPLAPPFNVGTNNYGGATISADNREMIFAKKNPVTANSENIDLYTTRYEFVGEENGKRIYQWTEPAPLESINTEKGWESQPSLSGDGKFLFFATVRPEVMKASDAKEIDWKSDIFVSQRQSDGSWGTPYSIGPVINTTGAEKSPYMHSDSHTLYFASTGHFGVGGFDLYYSRMNDDG
ncbi:MAG: PD40 domain-containing protein, partial [Flavobacteriales bacterium]|nr:PD40 domain-containing protein [Flavobacteriales bacterium]